MVSAPYIPTVRCQAGDVLSASVEPPDGGSTGQELRAGAIARAVAASGARLAQHLRALQQQVSQPSARLPQDPFPLLASPGARLPQIPSPLPLLMTIRSPVLTCCPLWAVQQDMSPLLARLPQVCLSRAPVTPLCLGSASLLRALSSHARVSLPLLPTLRRTPRRPSATRSLLWTPRCAWAADGPRQHSMGGRSPPVPRRKVSHPGCLLPAGRCSGQVVCFLL